METQPDFSWLIIAPQLTLVLTAAVILVLDFSSKKVERINLTLVALVGLVTAYLFELYQTPGVEVAFSDMVLRDPITTYLEKLFIIGAGLIVLIGSRYTERHRLPYGEYLVLMLFATVGMMVVAISADLVTLFMGIELLSLSLYILAGFNTSSLSSSEASLKYFILGALSTGFLVYGIAFVFGMCRTTNLIAIGMALTQADSVHATPLLIFGFVMILTGLGFKISLVPFHQWAPDVYQGAPTPVTAWIATGSKMAGFIALLKIFSLPGLSFYLLADTWIEGIWWLALLTMIIGNMGALVQNDIKRMLAYSSIAHGGYLAMAFVSHNSIGTQAILFYLAAYLFMTIGAFGVVIAVRRGNRECHTISDFAGLATQHPYLAGLMALFLFSLAGMPLTAGFVGKLWLFGAAVSAQYYILAVVGILTTLLSFYYYLRVIVFMWMKEPSNDSIFDAPPLSLMIGLNLAALGVLILGIAPNLIWKILANGLIG